MYTNIDIHVWIRKAYQFMYIAQHNILLLSILMKVATTLKTLKTIRAIQ
jgi:hypothetical protein